MPTWGQGAQVYLDGLQCSPSKASAQVVISEACATHGDSSDVNQGGKEMDLAPGSPLVLTHRIKLVAPDSGSRPGLCGCEADFAALRERLERLEREVSTLREKCGGAEGGCCTSKESKGAGCSIKPDIGECPNECSDQGRCMDGKCVCFPGFSGLDCSSSNCPRNCNDNGRCVNGQCVCDPGFVAPDCSQKGCPDNCNDQGRCVNGKCVCDSSYTGGFVGDDCSAISCPENCNSRGRCVNGQCVCDDGFTGSDCSERTCPSGCGDHGKCVNGKCECDGGFTGDDCSEISCPGNCNDRGRCVDGQCACDDGFTGPDCSDKACPNNCSNHGKCVNGKCVCNVGFAGPDCGAKGCPNNCNSKGRCVKARCVCRRGFRGPDCSQCEEGMTGPNCDTVMSGVSQLSTTEVTETSVTLAWTPPPIPYDTYHITFTSQKEGDQEISVPVEGSLTTFTQTGLAAGQEYTVSISGEVGGQRGAESTTQFMTLVSGPTNLQVVKTTSSSAVVQWEQSQGEIDRYRMTVSPNDGAGRSQEMTIQPDRDSAHIQELEAGRLYDIVLVASCLSIAEPATHTDKTIKKVLPGSARSFKFEDLLPQTEYAVTLLGKGPGLLSRLHKLVISTGPEPPTNIVFSEVTEDSLTVSWTKPNNPVHGFKVTYTNTEDGEPVSVSVDWEDSALGLSQLSPGSSYEVSVISILGLDESDPIKDVVKTLPDPPTDLQAINITDTKALLLWRPALATIDKYTIVYNSGKESELRVTVSGNAAEQQLSTLEGSTTYTVTIRSQLGDLESSPATTSFTTAEGSGGDEDAPRDLQASHVTPRTTLLSWKPPTKLANSYKLVYKTEGQEEKEVIVDAMVTEYNLTRLHPGAKYTAQLQAEEGGRYTSAVATEFTTGTLRFPFPSDCSQELLNGIRTSGEVEIFPQGKDGAPVMVYCDMDTDDGGWTVFQRRKDGSVDFFRSWKDYVKGFGDLSGEFWLGLDSLHNLTTMTKMVLRIDLRDGDESVFAKYSTFEVAKRHYRLTVGGYSGTAGDSLSYHNNRIFSTRDRDPAPFITRCAMSYRGGWWYKNCHEANLNGLYGIDVKHQGVIWTSWKGKDFSVPFTEMKMRPAAFSPPSSG
ncbi:LOW QUALITY PROTEIN: tenascin-R-like [Aulostomus maculatus]